MTPLAKRLPRELRRNIGKYLGIFLLMCGSIALTSGFLLAAHSIGCLIDDIRDAYTIEDGRVTTSFEATKDQLKAAEDAASDVGGVTLYKNFSIDAIIKKTAGDDGTKRTLRTYAHRTKVDIASYCEGKEPKADDEVAIDRVFATNNDLAVGDKVELEGRTYTICGIMTQPGSQALFLNNSDFTVNTITYGVAEVTDAGFAALEDAGGAPAYTYSFTFANRDLSTADRIDAEQDMVEALTDADARVDDLIDADSNQGIGYARDDVDGDSMMDDAARYHHRDHGVYLCGPYRRHHRGGECHHRHAARQRLSSTRDRAAPLLRFPLSWAWSRRFWALHSALCSLPSPCAASITVRTACRPSRCTGAGRSL